MQPATKVVRYPFSTPHARRSIDRVAKRQDSDRRLTKAERKEQARIEREEIQRRQASRARNRNLFIVAAVVVAGLVIGAIVLMGGDDGGPQTATPAGVTLPDPSELRGILQSPPPWGANSEQLAARLGELDLPQLSDAAGALHHHIELSIFVDGQQVTVPANIGLSQTAASPLHTHDETGIVHVESADVNFQPVLGQFMDVWGVYMTDTCLGAECNDGDRKLRVFVNGDAYTGQPTLLPLTDLMSVVIAFGSADQLPDPIPSAPPAI
jgi:hypothetical protein